MTKIDCHTTYPIQRRKWNEKADGGWGAYVNTGEPTTLWSKYCGDETMPLFCNCCGAAYHVSTNEKTRANSTLGIDVYAGHVGEAKETSARSVTHLTTKAGPLTIVLDIDG